MKILFTLSHYDYLSGAPLYGYELTKTLSELGHDVTVYSPRVSDDFRNRSARSGVRVVDTVPGPEERFDILHLNQPDVSRDVLSKIPDTPAISSIHSEWHYEAPVIDLRIKKYIAVRPSIKDKLNSKDGIPRHLIEVIGNPIDQRRFNFRSRVDKNPYELPDKFILFVGTVDSLRKESGLHLIEWAKKEGLNVVFVGQKFDTWLNGPLPKHVRWYPPIWDIEDFVYRCTMTAGIMVGRTTIEGWMMGKPGIVYDINLDGSIKDIEQKNPGLSYVRREYGAFSVARRVITEYVQVLHPEREKVSHRNRF